MSFPIFDVNVWKTGNEQLELLFRENGDEVGSNNIMEAYESAKAANLGGRTS